MSSIEEQVKNFIIKKFEIPPNVPTGIPDLIRGFQDCVWMVFNNPSDSILKKSYADRGVKIVREVESKKDLNAQSMSRLGHLRDLLYEMAKTTSPEERVTIASAINAEIQSFFDELIQWANLAISKGEENEDQFKEALQSLPSYQALNPSETTKKEQKKSDVFPVIEKREFAFGGDVKPEDYQKRRRQLWGIDKE